MHRGLSYKTKQIFFVLIKLSIVIGAFYYIYDKLTSNELLKFDDFSHFLIKNDAFSTKNIVFLLFLTIFNWFFEILKWQYLVNSVKKISFINSLKQSLASLTASLITPNRIGDYAVKAVYYHKTLRKRILLLNLMSHMAQMSVTFVLGIIGILIFIRKYDLDISPKKFTRLAAILIIVGAMTLFGIRQTKFKLRGFLIEKVIAFITHISLTVQLKTLLFSLIRYFIFSYQFYFLLILFGVEVSYLNAMIVITTMYLLSSIFPTFFVFDVVVKGSIAIYLFEIVGVNQLTTLSIITIMWLLNFILPSIIGSFYVLKFKRLNAFNPNKD